MQGSNHFSLPYSGMKDGLHRYRFVAGDDFFARFEGSPIGSGEFKIELTLDKRPGLSELYFDIEGKMSTACDRCTADIMLPVQGSYHLIVKTGNSDEEDVDVIYIREDQPDLDLSQVVYEFICLSVPMVHVYDCSTEKPRVCNMEVLSRLGVSEPEQETKPKGGVWDNLKDFLDN